jgi:hypothetical protein
MNVGGRRHGWGDQYRLGSGRGTRGDRATLFALVN